MLCTVSSTSLAVISTPFWEFPLRSAEWNAAVDALKFLLPFGSFLVCVLFEIFLSFSLKVFMKLIRTFVISSQNLALVF